MLARAALFALILACPPGMAAAQPPPPPATPRANPWNGDWTLSRARNTADVRDQAADGYRFNLDGAGRIRWEIPSLHEVVVGKTDGTPMVIRRAGVATPLTLSVTAVGPWVMIYRVDRDGRPEGEGRMTLVEQGKAWVDISGPASRPDLADVVIYVRPGAAGA